MAKGVGALRRTGGPGAVAVRAPQRRHPHAAGRDLRELSATKVPQLQGEGDVWRFEDRELDGGRLILHT